MDILHDVATGLFLAAAVALASAGALKAGILISGSSERHKPRRLLLASVEITAGVLAICYRTNQIAHAAILLAGAAFLVTLAVQAHQHPDQGCGCVTAAARDDYLAVSSFLRAGLIVLGGASGFASSTGFGAASFASLILWLLLIVAASPEAWGRSRRTCGGALFFARYDQLRVLRRSAPFQRLIGAGLIDRRPADGWREKCDYMFAFPASSQRGKAQSSQVAVFRVARSGVQARVVDLDPGPGELHSRPTTSKNGAKDGKGESNTLNRAGAGRAL